MSLLHKFFGPKPPPPNGRSGRIGLLQVEGRKGQRKRKATQAFAGRSSTETAKRPVIVVDVAEEDDDEDDHHRANSNETSDTSATPFTEKGAGSFMDVDEDEINEDEDEIDDEDTEDDDETGDEEEKGNEDEEISTTSTAKVGTKGAKRAGKKGKKGTKPGVRALPGRDQSFNPWARVVDLRKSKDADFFVFSIERLDLGDGKGERNCMTCPTCRIPVSTNPRASALRHLASAKHVKNDAARKKLEKRKMRLAAVHGSASEGERRIRNYRAGLLGLGLKLGVADQALVDIVRAVEMTHGTGLTIGHRSDLARDHLPGLLQAFKDAASEYFTNDSEAAALRSSVFELGEVGLKDHNKRSDLRWRWVGKHRDQFPHLAKIFLALCVMSANSCCVERVFSKFLTRFPDGAYQNCGGDRVVLGMLTTVNGLDAGGVEHYVQQGAAAEDDEEVHVLDVDAEGGVGAGEEIC